MAGARGGYAGFDRRVRLFAGFDAVEEILHVGDSAILEAGFGEDRILSFFRALAKDSEAATIYFQRGVGAAKLKAAIVDGRIHHALVNDVESGIPERRLNGVGAIPLLKDIFVRQSECLARLFNFHRPVNYVDPVSKQVSQRSTAKIPVPAPLVKFIQAKGLIWSRTQPHLPIKRLLVDGFGRPVALVVLPPIRPHLRNPAEAPTLNHVDGIAEVSPTALLHAALQNLFTGAHRL